MDGNLRKQWIVMPDELPAVIRRCPKCGRKTEFKNSGKFRVNANGRLIDVWLIFRCSVCDTSWNMAVWERVEAGRLDRKEYEGFLKNDPGLAVTYGTDRELFVKNKAETADIKTEYHILEMDTPLSCRPAYAMEIEVKIPAGLKVRTDLFLVRQLSVSRSRIKKLCEKGLILGSGRVLSPKSRVKDGMLLQIRKEAFEEEMKKEWQESDCC